jgi:hypothetical protein
VISVKKAFIAVLLLLALGCSQSAPQAEEAAGYIVATVGMQEEGSVVKTFNVRSLKEGFSPEVIDVD